MRPKLFQRLLEDALWPQDTKRGHGQSLCSTQIQILFLLIHLNHFWDFCLFENSLLSKWKKASSYFLFFCPSGRVRLKLYMFIFHVSTLVGKHLVNNWLFYPSAPSLSTFRTRSLNGDFPMAGRCPDLSYHYPAPMRGGGALAVNHVGTFEWRIFLHSSKMSGDIPVWWGTSDHSPRFVPGLFCANDVQELRHI